jgi:hypothetical protein
MPRALPIQCLILTAFDPSVQRVSTANQRGDGLENVIETVRSM